MANEEGQQISVGLPGVAVNKEQKTVTFEGMKSAYQFEAMSATYHLIVHSKKP